MATHISVVPEHWWVVALRGVGLAIVGRTGGCASTRTSSVGCGHSKQEDAMTTIFLTRSQTSGAAARRPVPASWEADVCWSADL